MIGRGKKLAFCLFAGIVLFAVIFLLFSKGGKRALNFVLPQSAASVNGQPIYTNQLERRIQLSKRFYQNAPQTEKETRDKALGQLIEEEKIRQVAARVGVTLNKEDILGEFEALRRSYEQQNQKPLSDYLHNLEITEDEFKHEIIEPSALLTKLAEWHHAQRNLNPKQFAKLDEIYKQLDNNADFSVLVSRYSEDFSGIALNGDIGFVETASMLPELQKSLSSAEIGLTKTVFSRESIHIIKIKAKDNVFGGRLYLQQLVLQPEDFSKWLSEQSKNYRIKIY